jgi:transcriptional regulator with PAS, ATPase and Fis domain
MLNRATSAPSSGPVTAIDTGRASAQVRTRFKALVQSPLRSGILRLLGTAPHDAHDVESVMQTFGRIRSDVDACLRELVNSGFVRVIGGDRPLYQVVRPVDAELCRILDEFLADAPGESPEDRSPGVQRFREMIGRDEKMMLIFESIRTVAKTELATLVLGPMGSGKDIVARVIHELSSRQRQTFQSVNCAALPDALFESEVFGYERGAIPGAYERKAGRMELAHRGTLFLDELSELSSVSQTRFLHAIDDRRVERLGGQAGVDVDVRLICATTRPLDMLVAEGAFREDLYYRINACIIRLPALRERPIDIPILAERYLTRHCAVQGLQPDAKQLAPDALDLLGAYPWPGNIRELESTISRAALATAGTVIEGRDLHFLHPALSAPSVDVPDLPTLRDVERDHIRRVLSAMRWNKKRAAEVLAISRETLYRKIAEYGLVAEARR